MSKKTEWLVAIERFIDGGDIYQIKGAAREIFNLDKNSADGPLALAEAECYLNNLDSAEYFLSEAVDLEKSPTSNLRGNFVKSLIFAAKFMPVSALLNFEKTMREENIISHKKKLSEEIKEIKAAKEDDKEKFVYFKILERYFALAANNYALLGEAKKAREVLYLASELSIENTLKLYSNFLFFSNYRAQTSSEAKRILDVYTKLSGGAKIKESFYRLEPKTGNRPIKIGYISGIFREHATLSFLPGLFSPPEGENFEIYIYNMGREDNYTRKLREYSVHWRNLGVLQAREAAVKISGDKLDILVDLAGHAEGSCLEVLSYRPAPVQITTLGYFASVGAPFIDYVISDKFLMPLGKSERFREKTLILHKHSALCYCPFELSKPSEISMPMLDNAYPTFICQQNLLKLSDDLLTLWKRVFDKLGDFRLILQNKTISTKEGKAHLQKRLKNLGFKLSQITLLPFSKDYKENLKKADMALDTTPYPGGITTCEALYNGIPVITLRGNDPWSRLGASILSAAHAEELIADTPKDYINIMLELSNNPQKLEDIKTKLLTSLDNSRLMDIKGYSKELFALYKKVYDEN